MYSYVFYASAEFHRATSLNITGSSSDGGNGGGGGDSRSYVESNNINTTVAAVRANYIANYGEQGNTHMAFWVCQTHWWHIFSDYSYYTFYVFCAPHAHTHTHNLLLYHLNGCCCTVYRTASKFDVSARITRRTKS